MITSYLTIDQLIPYVSRIREETREETERVIGYSQAQAPSMSDVLNIVHRVFRIRRNWRQLVERQCAMLQRLLTTDFTNVELGHLKGIAESIEGGVGNGRELLADTNNLGSAIRFLVGGSP